MGKSLWESWKKDPFQAGIKFSAVIISLSFLLHAYYKYNNWREADAQCREILKTKYIGWKYDGVTKDYKQCSISNGSFKTQFYINPFDAPIFYKLKKNPDTFDLPINYSK